MVNEYLDVLAHRLLQDHRTNTSSASHRNIDHVNVLDCPTCIVYVNTSRDCTYTFCVALGDPTAIFDWYIKP